MSMFRSCRKEIAQCMWRWSATEHDVLALIVVHMVVAKKGVNIHVEHDTQQSRVN